VVQELQVTEKEDLILLFTSDVLRLMGINCLAYLALRIYNSYNSATTRSNNLKVIADQSPLLVLYVVTIRNFYRILRLLCLELLFFALNS